ncbi:MAG: sugar transferase [Cyclobacteriaceae bacterium]
MYGQNQQQHLNLNPDYHNDSFRSMVMKELGIAENIFRTSLVKDKPDSTTFLIKRVFDVCFSILVLTLLSPVYLLLMLITKLTSKGSLFYMQERIGEGGKPFNIIKFRSMHVDAEKFGPQLTTNDDPRVTKWGKFMRKTHLDELPQFWNVLMGDMSIVGPRPERAHYIKQITSSSPSYGKLLTIKPGITSIGQVSYGYAENTQEMCERMEFDLLYLSEINLWTDINIIYQTVVSMFRGHGR